MQSYKDPTIFESLNARQLTPVQVAQTFLPPDFFQSLAERNHHTLIGPRGSGKTTLLKMLMLPALMAWKHPMANEMIQKIDFVSVFIPTDIAWKEQWAIVDNLGVDANRKELIKNAIFTAHTLRSMIESLKYRLDEKLLTREGLKRFYVNLPIEKEAELVRIISKKFSLDADIPSIDYLELQFRNRISIVRELINKSFGKTELPTDNKYDFIYSGFMESISLLIDFLNLYTESDVKWALLFDELEIAPKEIRQKLMTLLRSADERVLFKLSLSPYAEEFKYFSDPTSPSEHNDFKPINLWYPTQNSMREFNSRLFDQIVNSLGLENTSAESVFGPSVFVEESGAKSSYAKGTQLQKRYQDLAKIDPSFRNYLSRYSIALDHLDEMTEDKRAQYIRKIRNIVTYRQAYRRETGKTRSRKVPSLNTGAPTIFDVTEGNPRLFLGVLAPLIREYSHNLNTIKIAKQNEAVAKASNRYRALLGTIPVEVDSHLKDICGMNDLLDKIGNYFFERIVKDEFNPEPPTTFIVDVDVPPSIVKILELAVNAGAIIHIPDDNGYSILNSLINKRFRLSYLLSPIYKIPMVSYKGRILSKIILKQENQNLFDYMENNND